MPADIISRPRASIYIDGFNLYFGMLKDNPSWKWLNLQSLCEKLRPDDDVVAVNYFTAIVDEEKLSATKDRQKRYLKALSTASKVKVILGKYQFRDVMCRGSCREKYKVPEEKKTDVSIAIAMISDAIKGETERIVLISGDSDQEPAVQWIMARNKVVEKKIKITVYIPELPGVLHPRRNDAYSQMGVEVKRLASAEFPNCLFPRSVDLGSGRSIERPSNWP